MKKSELKITNIHLLLIIILVAAGITNAQDFSWINVPNIIDMSDSNADWGDYDNDGDLDLAITGIDTFNTGTPYTKIFRNDGAGVFTDILAGLTPSKSSGTVKWGDYNNDGQLDLFVCGHDGTKSFTRIYKNSGGIFNPIDHGIAAFYDGDADWGDYDNDGDLDLLVMGVSYLTRVYRNNGNDTFTDINAGLQGMGYGSCEWGDYDFDGDLDILVTGSRPAADARIYRNDSGTFTDIGANIFPLKYGESVWIDIESDGDLDFATAGASADTGLGIIYRNDNGSFVHHQYFDGYTYSDLDCGDIDNDGDMDLLIQSSIFSSLKIYIKSGGGFSEMPNTLINLYLGDIALADYDNDNDLDIFLCGDMGSGARSRLFRNNITTANTAPSAPTVTYKNVTGQTVLLSWGVASDPETPSAGLTYNVCVSTTYDMTGDILNPMADMATGFRKVARRGNAEGGHSAKKTLANLPGGKYYWAVQAIDNNYQGSLFSQIDSFEITIPVAYEDSVALAALYNSTDGDNWTDNTNWLTTEPIDTWFGIAATDGRVTEIILVDNNLVGTLPKEIGQLSALEYLMIWNNSISGSIPPEIGQLSNLLWLNFRINSISGSIPPEIGNLNSLISLSLSENDMTGSIPGTIGNLLNLERLYLYGNAFDGPIPAEIGNLTKLWRMWLDNNSFSGEIPMEIWAMPNLEELRLRENSLTGQLPMEIGQLSKLRELNLAINDLSGPIPAEIGNLDSLDNLTIDFNNFSGNIPATIGNLTKLTIIYLNGNSLTGAVPVSITNLANLDALFLYDNQLVDFPIVTSLQNLNVLQMENNLFTFEDIEPNISVAADTFIYAPQDSVGDEQWEPVEEGAFFTLFISVDGANNEYRWFKDGTAITGADAAQYNISAMTAGDAGNYVCRIKNTVATDLTLWSRPVHLTMQGVPALIDFDTDYYRVTHASLWASVNPNNTECILNFEYGLDTGYGSAVQSNDNPLNGSVDIDTYVEITGLSPGTTYHYRAVLDYNSVSIKGTDKSFTTDTYPTQVSAQASATFPSHPNAMDYSASDYRIIGLSGAPDLALPDMLAGEPHVDWEAYWDNGQDSNYWVRYTNSSTFRFTMGRAILIVSKNTISIDQTVPSATLDQFDSVIFGVHNGWNLFCNPFDIPVSWEDIRSENNVDNTLQQPWVFNGTYSQVSVIQPNTGYYFFNNQGIGGLIIPYQSSSTKRSEVNEYKWNLDISLNRENLPTDIIRLGVAEDAAPGMDPLDIYKPRMLDGSYGLSFQRREWDEKYTGFASDIRSDNSEVSEIFFDVDITPGEKANLAFSGMENIPEQYEIYLFDIERAVYRNLREKTSYDFVTNKSNQSFKLVIGNQTDIDAEIEALLPAEFSLGKNYPNPFNPETVIPITLPENSHVELSVYDVLGKKVITLHNGVMAAGRHYIRWTGKDQSGNSLSSGIYFYRLTSGGEKTFTGKMILMK